MVKVSTVPIEATHQLQTLQNVFNVAAEPTWRSLGSDGKIKLYARFGSEILQWSETKHSWLSLKSEIVGFAESATGVVQDIPSLPFHVPLEEKISYVWRFNLWTWTKQKFFRLKTQIKELLR